MYKFIENKYYLWYKKLCSSRKNRTINGYFEKHHIIPRSLGGDNSPNNLVNLTAKEHFIAHLLLIRCVKKEHTYKMVHAIIRFTTKINTSRQYELIRNYASKYSKGEFNCSFGKIWVHDFSGNILYIKEKDFDESIYIKGLPHQRGGFQHYQWINDKINEKLIPKNEEIYEGWSEGRIFKPSNDHMKNMSKKRHTKEKDNEHSQKIKGRITISDGGKIKRINPSDLEKYQKLGWIKTKKPPLKKFYEIDINNTSICYQKLSDFCKDFDFNPSTIAARLSRNEFPYKNIKSITKKIL